MAEKKFNYKHKSFKGTEAMVEWLNEKGIQPKQIVAVNYDREWVTAIWWNEQKEKNNG